MPETPLPDLVAPETWCGLRLGMSRGEAEAALTARGVDFSGYGTGSMTVSGESWELDLHFASDGSQRLRQIAVEEPGVVWSGRQLLDEKLDAALRLLEPCGLAQWTRFDAVSAPLAVLGDGAASVPTDAQLLSEGTVWLPDRGLGLVILDGAVRAVVVRGAQDLPTRYDGPVTPAQRELSLRDDVDGILRRANRATLADGPPDPARWPRRILTLATIAGFAMIGHAGFQEAQRWRNAQQASAKLLAIEQVPMKQFRDYLPPALRWIVPPSRAVQVEGYRIEFQDARDMRREVVLERGELYVPPDQIGDEVPVAVIDGDPPEVKGLARAQDAAFIEYVPLAIVLGAVSLFAHLGVGLVPGLFRRIGKLAVGPKMKDPDRPELS